MHLNLTADHTVDELEARLLLVNIEAAHPGIQGHKFDFTDLPNGQEIVAVLEDIPGTYDDFPTQVRELAARRGFDPEKINVIMRPSPDDWE